MVVIAGKHALFLTSHSAFRISLLRMMLAISVYACIITNNYNNLNNINEVFIFTFYLYIIYMFVYNRHCLYVHHFK